MSQNDRRLLNRRRLLSSAAAGGAGIALSAACGGRGSSGSAAKKPAVQQPKRGGVISYAGGAAGSYDTQGRTFDPMIQTQFGSKSYTLFYQRLLAYNLVNYKLEPELAQKWEQPNPSEYLFTLQPGVKWQNKPPVNGRALTADDSSTASSGRGRTTQNSSAGHCSHSSTRSRRRVRRQSGSQPRAPMPARHSSWRSRSWRSCRTRGL